MPSFSNRSMNKLLSCDARLQRLMNEVVKHFDCRIEDGYRSQADQEQAFDSGNSKAHYGQSKHNVMPSLAVDVIPYPVNWEDTDRIYEFAGFVKATAIQMGIRIRWGGNFKNFFDSPHFELIDNIDEIELINERRLDRDF